MNKKGNVNAKTNSCGVNVSENLAKKNGENGANNLTISLEKKISSPYALFQTKIPALEYMKGQSEDLHLFSRDITKDGHKEFIVSNYQTMYHLIIIKKDNNYYENFEGDQPVKLFIDIDIPGNKVKGDKDICFRNYIKRVIRLLDNELRKYGITDKPLVLKSRYWDTKLSGHMIYPTVVFENIYHMKAFFLNIDSPLITEKIIDPSVYKISCFRMDECCKMGKQNWLHYYDSGTYEYIDEYTLFMDSLVTLIPEKHHLIKIPDLEKKMHVTKTYHQTVKDGIEYVDGAKVVSQCILKMLLGFLDVKRADEYNDFTKVGMCCFNSNPESLGLWMEWSKQSSKYEEWVCIYKWNTFSNRGLTVGTLKYMARLDNPNGYDLAIPEPRLFDSIKINQQYLVDKDEPLEW